MPVKCRLIPDPYSNRKVGGLIDIKPGDMWYWSEESWAIVKRDWADPNTYLSRFLGLRYVKQDMVERPPLTVCLPSGETWNMDYKPSQGGPEGWQLSGTAPEITASPSIQTGVYHGWLRAGVLSDDIDGRTYGDEEDL